MKAILTTTAAILLTALPLAKAELKAFNFDDPKGVNTISFMLDAPLESITGSGDGITGKIHFDPHNPAATKGKIVLDAKTLTVPNGTMEDHMHSEKWLATDQYGEIVFEAKEVSQVKEEGSTIKTHITGDLTLHGVTKEITIPVTMTYLPNKLGERSNGQMEGDLLVVRSNFSVNRSDFGIMPGKSLNKVAEEIELRMALAGYHSK